MCTRVVVKDTWEGEEKQRSSNRKGREGGHREKKEIGGNDCKGRLEMIREMILMCSNKKGRHHLCVCAKTQLLLFGVSLLTERVCKEY